jgi:hypothetical protein
MSIATETRSGPAPQFVIAIIVRALPAWAVATVLALLVYATVQQAHRSMANDPQIQVAEDATRALGHGADPRTVAGASAVDLAASLAVWTTVFDAENHVLASTAVLDGSTPTPPSGVLETARRERENRVSWEPRSGVRSATVSVAVPGGSRMVVTVGRSLREIEAREQRLELIVAAAWLASLLAGLMAATLSEWLVRR